MAAAVLGRAPEHLRRVHLSAAVFFFEEIEKSIAQKHQLATWYNGQSNLRSFRELMTREMFQRHTPDVFLCDFTWMSDTDQRFVIPV